MFFRKWIDESEFDGKNDFYDNSVMSVRQWMATLAIMLIPGVNIIMLLWWAFANKELAPSNKVNWARASIIVLTMILFAIGIVTILFYWGWYIHNNSF